MFLRALGLGVAAPLAFRLSRDALAQSTPAPKRFLLFYMPHGAPPEHFKPQVMPDSPTTFALDQSGVSVLGPLQEQFKDYVRVIQGINYPGAQTHEGIVSCLSGISTFSGGTTVDETTPRTTVEHAIANGLGVTPLVLGAVPHRPFGLDKDGKLMWDGTPVVPEKSPLAAYDSVFGGIGQGGGEVDPNVEFNAALHALTESEVAALKSELTSLTAEQTKLQQHLEAIQALKSGGGGGAISCTTAPTLAGVEALRTAASGQGDDYWLKEENFPKILEAQLQIAAAAIKCNARQVVAVQPMYTNCELDFGFMGSNGGHHSQLSHTQPQQDASGMLNITTRESFAKAQRWFVQQLTTHVLESLLDPDPADPSKKIIDNTIVYFMSEIGEGAYHTTKTGQVQPGPGAPVTVYIPSVIIGGGGGALSPGKVVTFATDRPAGDVYLSLCQAMGVTGATFGNTTGPVTEVLA